MTRYVQNLKLHAPLLLILAVFSALTLYQSAVLPLGEAADETDHYQYLRFVARTGHPPLTEAEREAAGFKGGLAPLYYWLAAWPIALVGEDTLPDIRRVDARPQRHLPTDGLGINRVLHTLDEQWPWRGQPLAWHLARLLSLPLGWVTIIATYALARRLFAARAIAVGAAAFVALLPRFIFSAAVINDDNLVFALIALLLLVQVMLLQGDDPPSPRLMGAFGALFGLALVTKYFSLILLPEILFTLGVLGYRSRGAGGQGRRGDFTRPLAAFGLALFFAAGLWFIFIVARFNRVAELGWIAGLAASLGEPQITEGLVGLLAGQSVRPPAATYSLLDWLGLLYRSFWFEFGWMRIFAPGWVYWLFGLFTVLGLADLTRMAQQRPTPTEETKKKGGNTPPSPPPYGVYILLALHLVLFVTVVLGRYILSATIDTGQGRHLYPALPVIALLLSAGWYGLSHNRQPATSQPLLLTSYSLLLAITFLLPAFIVHHPQFTIQNYHTHPVTTAPIAPQFNLEFAPGLALVGFDAPTTATAGEALPVTLAWHAAQPGRQDYLLSLCLEDEAGLPVACARRRFEDGRYPPAAWEPGDTLLDTVHLPLPVCYRLTGQPHTLRLQLWPLDAAAVAPAPTTPPALDHRFAGQPIAIRPTDSLHDRPQSRDLWLADARLTAPVALSLGQAVEAISYAAAGLDAPQFTHTGSGATWQPVPTLTTDLHLPCDDGPAPFARLDTFLVDAALQSGEYDIQGPEYRIQNREESSFLESVLCTLDSGFCAPAISLTVRQRQFAPAHDALTFGDTLAPLTLTAQSRSIRLEPVHAETPTERIELPAGTPLPVDIEWRASRRMAQPLVVALKLVDGDFAVGGQRIATLGDRYPSVLWQPTELVSESYPLQPAPDAPPGLYRLELGLLRQDAALPAGYENLPLLTGDAPLGQNLYPLAVRLLDAAHGAPPPTPLAAQVGDRIRLTGVEVNPLLSDSPQTVRLALYWESTGKIEGNYTVFTQLLGPDGQVWAQWDNPPQGGRYPTPAWLERDSVVDRYTLTLREGAPPGDYRLLVGMYDAATGERLPASVNGRPQPDNAIEAGRLAIGP
ncbi:MAG: hypothetical protein Kow0031_00370 [Anaerolineae bacterium]